MKKNVYAFSAAALLVVATVTSVSAQIDVNGSASAGAGVNATLPAVEVDTKANMNANINAGTRADDGRMYKDDKERPANSASMTATTGNGVSVVARMRFLGSEVRAMTEEEKQEFLMAVQAHAQLQSGKDLENFAKGILVRDENAVSVEVSEDDSVEATYKVPARFLGIFKSMIRTNVEAEGDANGKAEAKVTFPWYRFLYRIDESVDRQEIEAKLDAAVESAASAETPVAVKGVYLQAIADAMASVSAQ